MLWISTCILVCAQLCGNSGTESAEPFRLASIAPDDVTLFVHIENAADVRRELSDRPMYRWIESMLDGGAANDVWNDLAATSQVDPITLFDLCFGTRSTLMVRDRDEVAEWALITEIPVAEASVVLARFNPVSRGPRHQIAIWELPEHDLLIARGQRGSALGEGMLVIGPKAHAALFRDVLKRIATQPDQGTLSRLKAIERGAAFGPGFIGVYLTHKPPMGGWSVVVAQLTHDLLTLKHHASFENAPFDRSVTQQHVDSSPLHGFENHALFAIIEPTDIGGGQLQSFIQATFQTELFNKQLRRQAANRRIFAVGEIEGRQETEPVDLQATTLAVCLELSDITDAEAHLDRQMVQIAKRLNDLGGDRFDIHIPCQRSFEPGASRSIDISPAMQWLTGALPIARPVTLNWTVVHCPESVDADPTRARGWAIVASHPEKLADSVRALQQRAKPTDARAAHSSGFASGSRIGQHLRSWSSRPELFVDPDNKEQLEEFRSNLLLMSRFASGINRATWHLTRPCATEMCLNVELQLAPPKSARE